MARHKARELQANPLRTQRTYKPRTGFTHSEAWRTVRALSESHRLVSMTVEAGDRCVIRAYD